MGQDSQTEEISGIICVNTEYTRNDNTRNDLYLLKDPAGTPSFVFDPFKISNYAFDSIILSRQMMGRERSQRLIILLLTPTDDKQITQSFSLKLKLIL